MVKKQLLLRVLLDKTVHIWLNFCWEKDMKFMVWYGMVLCAARPILTQSVSNTCTSTSGLRTLNRTDKPTCITEI